MDSSPTRLPIPSILPHRRVRTIRKRKNGSNFRSPSKQHPHPFPKSKPTPLSAVNALMRSQQISNQINQTRNTPMMDRIKPKQPSNILIPIPSPLPKLLSFQEILTKIDTFPSPPAPTYLNTSSLFPLVADKILRHLNNDTINIKDEGEESTEEEGEGKGGEEEEDEEVARAKDLEKIMKMKKAYNSAVYRMDLQELYQGLLAFSRNGLDLMDSYVELYRVFEIQKKKPLLEDRKTILNNLNYKIKTLYRIYPHLANYGSVSMFTFRTVSRVPEVLLRFNHLNTKAKFEEAQGLPVPNQAPRGRIKNLR